MASARRLVIFRHHFHIMRKIVLLFALLAGGLMPLHAQVNRCGTTEHEALLKANDQDYEVKKARREAFIAKYADKLAAAKMEGGEEVITIPVVFHIVYNTAAENISEAHILEQLDILNADFRRLNADTTETPEPFQDVAADFNIEFCLASFDPDGNPTPGIIRYETPVTSFSDNDDVKFADAGGADAWPADSYLNFWVCDLGPWLLGYAQFPGGPANTDGVVIGYQYVGYNDAGYPYNLGRTATHEIGHWLDLYHIWGDDTNCAGSDVVGDTPNQKVETYGCPSYPKTDVCSATAPGIMFMNYMDYTDDACMNMFTLGQKTRARALFEPGGDRYAMLSSDGCGLQPYDAEALAALPGGTVCDLSITPVVTIKNRGFEVLTSLDITYSIDGGTPLNYEWTGSLISAASEVVTLPAVATTAGEHTLEVTLSNPNGNTDADATDNVVSTEFLVNTGSLALPLVEGFEPSGFPYDGYTINNPDDDKTWARTNYGASLGDYSIYINNYNYDASGEIDEFVVPAYDFTGLTEVFFTFDVAYALYTATGVYSDTLEVLVSDDCGTTWSSLYKKANPDLQTTPPTTSNFKPESDEWRTETIDLSAYIGEPQVFVKFRNTTDYENNLYIDNININDGEIVQGVSHATAYALNLYPNPTSDNITLRFNTPAGGDYTIRITDVTGKLVFTNTLATQVSENVLRIPSWSFESGLYHIQLSNGVEQTGATFIKD